MGFRYAVIGSGRQGTSAAFDLARFGDADYVLLADQSLSQAERAAARVNHLVGREIAQAVQVEVQDENAVVAMLKPERSVFEAEADIVATFRIRDRGDGTSDPHAVAQFQIAGNFE